MRVEAAHAYFCHDNDLPRIDATTEQRRRTYLLLAEAALKEANRLEKTSRGEG